MSFALLNQAQISEAAPNVGRSMIVDQTNARKAERGSIEYHRVFFQQLLPNCPGSDSTHQYPSGFDIVCFHAEFNDVIKGAVAIPNVGNIFGQL